MVRRMRVVENERLVCCELCCCVMECWDNVSGFRFRVER